MKKINGTQRKKHPQENTLDIVLAIMDLDPRFGEKHFHFLAINNLLDS